MRAHPRLPAQQHHPSPLPPPTPAAAACHVAAAGTAPAAAGRASCRQHASSHAAATASAVLQLATEAQQHVGQTQQQQRHDSSLCVAVQQPLGFVHVAGGVVSSSSSSNGSRSNQQRNARYAPPPRSGDKQRQWAAAQVTRRIKECATWQQVDAIVQTHGPTFNIINTSAALSHLAQLKQAQEQRPLPPPCAAVARQQLASDNQQQVVGLHAVTSQMEQQHQQASVAQQQHAQQQLAARLLRLALPLLDQAGSRQVGNMLWAAAVLGLPAASTAAASALLQRGVELCHGAEAQHLSHIALAAAKLRLPVDGRSLQQLQQAWLGLMRQEQQQQRERLACDDAGSSSSGEVCSSSSVASKSAEHLAAAAGNGFSIQAAATTSNSSITPQATCNLLWAVVQLQAQQQQPPQQQQSWLQEVVAAAAPLLGRWPGKSVAMLLWAAARLGYQQPGISVQQQDDGVARLLLHTVQQHAATLSVQDLSQCLWAAAAMKVAVPRATLEHLLREGSRQLQQQQQLKQGRLQQPKQQHGLVDRPLRAVSKAAAERATWLAQHPPSAQLAHSTSLLLWSVAQLSAGQRQLLSDVLRPWLQVLAGAVPAASHTSLGVAAWALCKLGERACCPSLVLALLMAANKRAPEGGDGSNGSSVSGVSNELAAVSKEEASAGLVVSLVWAAATCVRAAAPTQQQEQQQHKQQAGGRLQPRTACAATDERCVQDVRAAAQQLLLHQQAAPAACEVLPRASLRQLAMLLWACCQLQLQLPEAWWRDCLSQLGALLVVQQQQQPAGVQGLQAAGQSLALCVWALGKQRVLVPPGLMARLQQASLAVLQQQQEEEGAGVLAPEGCAQLLLGFTRLATTAGWQLPRQRHRHHRSSGSSDAGATLLVQPPLEQQQQQQARWPTAAGVSDAWLRCFCAAAEPSLAVSGSDSLVGTLWALGRLRYHPGHAFIAAAQRRALELLPGLGPRHVAVLLWAHARLRAPPHPRLVRAWERQLASADTPDQQQAGWALREAGCGGGGGGGGDGGGEAGS